MELPITGKRLGFRLEALKIIKQHDAVGRRKNFFLLSLVESFRVGRKAFLSVLKRNGEQTGRNWTTVGRKTLRREKFSFFQTFSILCFHPPGLRNGLIAFLCPT
ncbi:hypothetical protein CEXT_651041 [Caerostris extrusa]|uniref:Uncharacterized protein n=1 Tax=Caerostris extrusa TaxID=172846 RepID=A0AAV4Y398_CAEEX|nr:hypothetical protein CEXT_651041 [Caerostris extrusa]